MTAHLKAKHHYSCLLSNLNDGQTLFTELQLRDKGSRRKISHLDVHEVHNFQRDEWICQSWKKCLICLRRNKGGRVRKASESIGQSVQSEIKLDQLCPIFISWCWLLWLRTCRECGRRVGTKQTVAEVEARSSKPQRLSPSFISPQYHQINQDSLSLYPRESSRPVMNSVKKKISSEEKLSEDPPAFPSAWP